MLTIRSKYAALSYGDGLRLIKWYDNRNAVETKSPPLRFFKVTCSVNRNCSRDLEGESTIKHVPETVLLFTTVDTPKILWTLRFSYGRKEVPLRP